MFSAYNAELPARIRTYLIAQGHAPEPAAEKVLLSVFEAAESPLARLFSFPYMDFAFVRYDHEIVPVAIGGARWEIFGTCSIGVLARGGDGSVALIREAEPAEQLAPDMAGFVTLFHLMARLVLQSGHVAPSDYAPLEATGTEFWETIAYEISDGFAAPVLHTLSAALDGMLTVGN